MDINRMMELISMQRHDFLNHLQVVSGLLQLNRGEQARDYIKKVAWEVARLSRVVHLKIPEVAAAVLLAHYAAAEREISTEYEVTADLGGCTVPGTVLGPALEAVLLYIVERSATPENPNRAIHVGIRAAANGYLITVQYNRPEGENDRPGDGALQDTAGELAKFGGALKIAEDGPREITVFLPASGF